MNVYIKGMLLFFIAILASACRHSDDMTCMAGSGGDVEVVVYANHNGTNLINYLHPDTAFVKYGTTTSPGNSPAIYDTYFVSEEFEDHIHVTHMKCGSYYIYRTAFDSVANKTYYGGLGITFSQTTGEIDTTIIVN